VFHLCLTWVAVTVGWCQQASPRELLDADLMRQITPALAGHQVRSVLVQPLLGADEKVRPVLECTHPCCALLQLPGVPWLVNRKEAAACWAASLLLPTTCLCWPVMSSCLCLGPCANAGGGVYPVC
jgi:hypothetical protein